MKTQILLLFIFSYFCSYSQVPTGVYKRSYDEYLSFQDSNKVSFLIKGEGCFGEERYIGEGKYKLKGKTLIIDVESHNKKYESTITQINAGHNLKTDELLVFIKDKQEKPISGVNIIFKEKLKGKKDYLTDENGLAIVQLDKTDNTLIEFLLLGYIPAILQTTAIKFDKLEITLSEGNVSFLDNKNVKLNLELNEIDKTFQVNKLTIK